MIYFIVVAGQFVVPQNMTIILGIIGLLVMLTGAVFTFLLAIKVYGVGLGILFGILCLVPVLGLIVLLLVNGKATGVLKQNGIRVGLIGADVSSI